MWLLVWWEIVDLLVHASGAVFFAGGVPPSDLSTVPWISWVMSMLLAMYVFSSMSYSI